MSYTNGAILILCYIVIQCWTYIDREFKSSRQAQVAQVAIFKVESKYIDTGPELRDSEMELGLENVDDKWIFSGLLQHNQIKSGPSFKAFNDRNQTSKALTSCGVRMSSEFWWRRRSTRRSHDVFITLEIRGFFLSLVILRVSFFTTDP